MEKYQRVKLDRREFMRFTRRGGAGVVGRPGSTRGDSLPTLKREKNVSPSASEILRPHIARGKHGIGDWTGTGGGCGGGEAHLPIICPAEHLSE